MHARKMVAKGFTLVEILIVVVILGILAAIVIPQFTNASEAAKSSSLQSQLQSIRSQIELYKNQHNDDVPDLTTANWAQFTLFTDVAGTTGTAKDTTADPPVIYGPYMQKPAVNPFTGVSTVDGTPTTDGTPADSVGWVWDGGILKAVIGVNKGRDLSLLGAAETSNADYASFAD